MAVSCPHCGQKTELSIPVAHSATNDGTKPKSFAVRIITALFILVAAGVAGFVYWQKRKIPAVADRPSTNAVVKAQVPVAPKPGFFLTNRLALGTITLEKAKNSSVVYALGQIKNESDEQRFGLKVELDLLDSSGSKIGTATDYISILEPRKGWNFRALVLERRAVSARLASIKEDQ